MMGHFFVVLSCTIIFQLDHDPGITPDTCLPVFTVQSKNWTLSRAPMLFYGTKFMSPANPSSVYWVGFLCSGRRGCRILGQQLGLSYVAGMLRKLQDWRLNFMLTEGKKTSELCCIACLHCIAKELDVLWKHTPFPLQKYDLFQLSCKKTCLANF